MKKLIVYYSSEDDMTYFAEMLAKEIKADLLCLQTAREKKTKGFLKSVWGIVQAMMKRSPRLLPYETKVNKYEEIIIATPVIAGTFSPPIRTFIEEENIVTKRVAYIYMHSGRASKVESQLEEALIDNHLLGSLDLKTHKITKEENGKNLIEWAKKLNL